MMKTLVLTLMGAAAMVSCQQTQQQVVDEKACDIAQLDFTGVDLYAGK